jgi:hypothetical protein
MVPDPSIRREGTVVDNTFVYGLPEPSSATDAVLTVGQMWFAVDQEEGSDGQIWYKVYISGGYGWVPSSAMVLNAPFDEEEPSAEPAAEPEEEPKPLVTNPVALPTIGGGGARPGNP